MNSKAAAEALQKESNEKNTLVVEHDDLQQQHQKLTEERTQLDERAKNVEEQLNRTQWVLRNVFQMHS